MSIVRRYLEAVAAHDWEAAETCLSEHVVRIGPFGDTYRGRGPYLEGLQKVMEGLRGYSMQLGRIVTGDNGATVTAELDETVEMDGSKVLTHECLVFDLDESGLISGIRIYIQTA